jgi:hypothetical protein
MQRRWSLLALVLLSSSALAEQPPPAPVWPGAEMPIAPQPVLAGDGPDGGARDALASNRNFPNFIGFLSNPLQSIDPRSLTQIWPVFLSSWVSPSARLPAADGQVYGAGLNLALTDRLSVGLNQGGYSVIHVASDRERLLRLRGLPVPDQDRGGTREGWLNLGGFVQYTFLEDVPNQFLATAGLRWEAPSGSTEVFQGHGPVHLSPYLTVGKEFGCFHVLATTGFQFPVESDRSSTQLLYLNVHLDRQCFGWLYPLVEVNWTYHTTSIDFSRRIDRGFFDLGPFDASGNIVVLSVGANTVIVQDRVELGAVYNRSVATQRDFGLDGVLVKLILCY